MLRGRKQTPRNPAGTETRCSELSPQAQGRPCRCVSVARECCAYASQNHPHKYRCTQTHATTPKQRSQWDKAVLRTASSWYALCARGKLCLHQKPGAAHHVRKCAFRHRMCGRKPRWSSPSHLAGNHEVRRALCCTAVCGTSCSGTPCRHRTPDAARGVHIPAHRHHMGTCTRRRIPNLTFCSQRPPRPPERPGRPRGGHASENHAEDTPICPLRSK